MFFWTAGGLFRRDISVHRLSFSLAVVIAPDKASKLFRSAPMPQQNGVKDPKNFCRFEDDDVLHGREV